MATRIMNKCCCGEILYCPSSILICGQCLEGNVTKSSTKPTLEDTQTSLKVTAAVLPTVPKDVQIEIEWDEFQSAIEEHDSRLTPVEPKKVNLQPSSTPPLPQIRDPGPGPQVSQAIACAVEEIFEAWEEIWNMKDEVKDWNWEETWNMIDDEEG
jgi:hypothetical protein